MYWAVSKGCLLLFLCLRSLFFFLKIKSYEITILSFCPSLQLVDQLTGFPEICYGRYTIETHPNAFIYFCAVGMGECSRVTYPAAYVEFELMGLF